MVSLKSKEIILSNELESCENTIYLHEVRVECGTRTNDEKMVKANQDAITKLLLARNILRGMLDKVTQDIKAEVSCEDSGSVTDVPSGDAG